MKLVYGFTQKDDEAVIDSKKAEIVKIIFLLYLSGYSLGGIAIHLKKNSTLSPTGKETWSRLSIDKMLSNKKYLAGIISFKTYTEVQFEKDKRSNTNDNRSRKTTKYHSGNVLSGLLICGDCGKNYRRITRSGGEVVWRCADKVEHGAKSACDNSATIFEKDVEKNIVEHYGVIIERKIRETIQKIIVQNKELLIVTWGSA